MKTTVITSGKENGIVKNLSTDKSAIRPSVSFEDKIKEEANGKPKTEAEGAKPVEIEADKQTEKETKEVNASHEALKAEPSKAELREVLQEQKPAMSLDATIKLALDLNRRINQRGKLLETIGTLEAFEILQKDDAEETDSNHFQGCVLTLEDDKNREFTTKNPFIINAVAKMVNQLCVDKLAEIEGEIFIPVK